MSVVGASLIDRNLKEQEFHMSKNAKKFQKRQASKHNQRCSATPKKARYRDLEEAKDAMFIFKRKAKEQRAATG